MRKPILFLLLPFAFLAHPASADPLRITSGVFVLDFEGDTFTFSGDGFALTTTEFGIYSTKQFVSRGEPRGGWPPTSCYFCDEPEENLSDWGFATIGGEQLLGRGNVSLGDVSATNVEFVGSMRFNAVPTRVSPSGGALEGFGLVAPFSFEATIRGIQSGDELFSRQFIGIGQVAVPYERSTRPGFVRINGDAGDTLFYRFSDSAAPIPEPGTLLLLGSGLAAAVRGRRRNGSGRQPSRPFA
jgi:hypothetical protein